MVSQEISLRWWVDGGFNGRPWTLIDIDGVEMFSLRYPLVMTNIAMV